MKKIFLISSSTVAVLVVGFFAWQHHHNCDSASGYSNKMSMACELSCSAKDVDPSKLVAQSKAHVGDYTKCPISGVVFQITNESTQITYENKTAYTCCETCSQIFKDSPKEYAANIN